MGQPEQDWTSQRRRMVPKISSWPITATSNMPLKCNRTGQAKELKDEKRTERGEGGTIHKVFQPL